MEELLSSTVWSTEELRELQARDHQKRSFLSNDKAKLSQISCQAENATDNLRTHSSLNFYEHISRALVLAVITWH